VPSLLALGVAGMLSLIGVREAAAGAFAACLWIEAGSS
jgi:hypothetical protein